MLLPNRHGNSGEYRYGFQGQEKDDEIKGEGNSINFTFRMHDSRVGRFFSIDPLTTKYPHYSPYSFSGNNVIAFKELEGLEEMVATINENTGQPNFFAVNGQEIEMIVLSSAFETISEASSAASIKIAFREIGKGNVKLNTGEVINQNRHFVTRDIQMIDGSVYKDVTLGRDFGSKRVGRKATNAKIRTSQGINQVQAFRPNFLRNVVSSAAKAAHLVDLAEMVDFDSGSLNANAALEGATSSVMSEMGATSRVMGVATGIAVSFLLNTTESYIADLKAADEPVILEMLLREGNSLSTMENVINSPTFGNLQIVSFSANTIEKYLTGEIRDLNKLLDYDFDNGSGDSGHLLLHVTDDNKHAIIHAIYLPFSEEADDKK